MFTRRVMASAFVLLLSAAAVASASPKPTATPGGSNQMAGISGKLGQELWNGVLRFKLVELREASKDGLARTRLLLVGGDARTLACVETRQQRHDL